MEEIKEDVEAVDAKSPLELYMDELVALVQEAIAVGSEATSHKSKCEKLSQLAEDVSASFEQIANAAALFDADVVDEYFAQCKAGITKVVNYNKEFAKTGGFAKLLSGGDAKTRYQELELELTKLAEESTIKISGLIPIFETFEVREGYKTWSPSTLKICDLFAAASPESPIIFTAQYGQKDIEIFEPDRHKAHRVKRIPTSGKVLSIAAFEDRLFVACAGEPSIQVFQNDGKSRYEFEFTQTCVEHEDDVEALFVDINSRRMFSGSYDGTVAVWDLDLLTCLQTWNIGRQVTTNGLCVSEGRLLILTRPATLSEKTYVLIYDLANLKQPRQIELEHMAHIFHGIGMYGPYVFHAAPNKAFRNEIWATDLNTMQQHGVVAIDGGLAPDCFGWRMNGPFLVIAKYGEGDVYVFDVRNSSVICTLQHTNGSEVDPDVIRGIAFVGPYLSTCARAPLRGDPALEHCKTLHFWDWGLYE